MSELQGVERVARRVQQYHFESLQCRQMLAVFHGDLDLRQTLQ